MRTSFSIKRIHLMGALGLVCGLAIGCSDGTGPLRTTTTCADYCAKANECDSDVDTDECESDCKDKLDDCMADEQEQALDDLDSCAANSCDEFAGCTIGAGLQCTFGI
ncbi:MAG: hypothetical protein JNL82_35395 [Myxococcales bacterium]|nr:hypothetical protein [Myxococcales bacterium]